MKNTHPIEVAIVLAWLVAEAVLTLLVAAAALVVALLPPGAAPAAPPAEHPLITVAAAAAEPLQLLTVADLRRLARAAGLPRTLTRSGRRDALLTALVGLEVAACV